MGAVVSLYDFADSDKDGVAILWRERVKGRSNQTANAFVGYRSVDTWPSSWN